MNPIDKKWLEELGVEAAEEDIQELVDRANSEWELRIGLVLMKSLSDKQIGEFKSKADGDEKIEWLEQAIPNYHDEVSAQKSLLAEEISNAKDKIALIMSWKRA